MTTSEKKIFFLLSSFRRDASEIIIYLILEFKINAF